MTDNNNLRKLLQEREQQTKEEREARSNAIIELIKERKKIKELDPYKEQRERAKRILAFIKKKERNPTYKATPDEEKLIYKPNNKEKQ